MDKNTVYKRTLSQAKERLTIVQEQEKEFNKQVSNNNKQIKQISIKNKKLAKKISSHMKYMNQLVSEITEKFKQSKSKKEEPQWEILEIESYGGEIRKLIDGEYRLYTDGVGFTATYLLQRSDSKIKTVKRLSDGEVFSVGDVITGFSFNDGRKINRFSIQNGKLWISQKSGDCEIQHIKKVAPKEEQVPIKNTVSGFGRQHSDYGIWYEFMCDDLIPTKKYQSIKEAIEGVLNETLVELNNEQLGKILMSFHKNHSEELLQARRDAFDAAREVVGYSDALKNSPVTVGIKYKDNEDYINSLNK